MTKQNISVDFDGVLNEYSGYNPNNIGKPRNGVENFLAELHKAYNIIIFTCRSEEEVYNWLKEYDLYKYVNRITDEKLPSVAYIDDRAIQFNGDYLETINELAWFKPYWEHRISAFFYEDYFSKYIDTLKEEKDIEHVINKLAEDVLKLKKLQGELILQAYADGKLEFKQCTKSENIIRKQYNDNFTADFDNSLVKYEDDFEE